VVDTYALSIRNEVWGPENYTFDQRDGWTHVSRTLSCDTAIGGLALVHDLGGEVCSRRFDQDIDHRLSH
jgi:hypothetical protein